MNFSIILVLLITFIMYLSTFSLTFVLIKLILQDFHMSPTELINVERNLQLILISFICTFWAFEIAKKDIKIYKYKLFNNFIMTKINKKSLVIPKEIYPED